MLAELPPLINATIKRIRTAAPTTQTHGSVYQTVVVVVVVVLDLLVVVLFVAGSSCARVTSCSKSKVITEINLVDNVFMITSFLIRIKKLCHAGKSVRGSKML